MKKSIPTESFWILLIKYRQLVTYVNWENKRVKRTEKEIKRASKVVKVWNPLLKCHSTAFFYGHCCCYIRFCERGEKNRTTQLINYKSHVLHVGFFFSTHSACFAAFSELYIALAVVPRVLVATMYFHANDEREWV